MNIRDKPAELSERGFCILNRHFPIPLIDACRAAFWPTLLDRLKTIDPNRGPNRYFLPMPFHPPCFTPQFFFDPTVLHIVRTALGDSFAIDQFGCDIPVEGSEFQTPHVDYQRPLFPELPNLLLPPYMLVLSFGLAPISKALGPIEIAPGTHRMPRDEAIRAVQSGEIPMQPIPLELGDVLIRHPWSIHRGTPNTTNTPRPLVTIRHVRKWYADNSRQVNAIPRTVWELLTPEQRNIMNKRFAVV
jgi:ectoine hydroxylase-related dioxygenase (phytanoyl-CoA dioxygenase family)